MMFWIYWIVGVGFTAVGASGQVWGWFAGLVFFYLAWLTNRSAARKTTKGAWQEVIGHRGDDEKIVKAADDLFTTAMSAWPDDQWGDDMRRDIRAFRDAVEEQAYRHASQAAVRYLGRGSAQLLLVAVARYVRDLRKGVFSEPR